MKKIVILQILLGCFLCYPSFGQDIQWASSVVDASSELGQKSGLGLKLAEKVFKSEDHLRNKAYSAGQALGYPNAMPQGGDNPVAWSPNVTRKEEYLMVAFQEAMAIQRVFICANLMPGAVKNVYAYDTDSTEYLLKEYKFQAGTSKGVVTVSVDKTPYMVQYIKVVLHGGKEADGQKGIDAIGISGEPLSFEPKVNLNEEEVADVPIRLNWDVNSKSDELLPVITPDGKRLYYARRKHPENIGGVEDLVDIWVSDFKDGKWQPATNLGRPFNNEGSNFLCSITPDGHTMLLGRTYNSDTTTTSGASMTQYIDGAWTPAIRLNVENHYNHSDQINYSLSNTGRILIISAERDDTYGGRDLYVSFKRGVNDWTEPVNMGPQINTAAEEMTPFLASDNKTLYFSSKGFPGYGEEDVFVTRRLDKTYTLWSEPQNLGPSINTPKSEQYFSLPASGAEVFFSSGREDTNLDLFSVKIPESMRPASVVLVVGKVFNKKTGEPLEANVIYENLADGEEVGVATSDKLGKYEVVLPSGENYGLLADLKDFLAINQNVDIPANDAFRIVEQDLYLVPIEKGSVVPLNNVWYHVGKHDLKDESKPELDRKSRILLEYKDLNLIIAGHTDNTGSKATNDKLSQERAKEIADYIIQKGYDPAKITVKGFGSSKPIASNDTEEGRFKNRRVELIID